MRIFKKYFFLLEILFFIIIFALSILPLKDFDLWFHLKSGELITQKGIIHYDVFSHSAAGREWLPYEWLFQITIYFFAKWFGFEAIKYLVAAVVTAMVGLLYITIQKIFRLNPLLGLFVSLFFFASVYEFFVARPQIFAYTFLIIIIYLILLYVYKNKDYLWIAIPVTLIWTNLHGSIFLDVALFGAYSIVCFILYLMKKESSWLQKTKILCLYTVVVAIITILPPLGFTQYRLLWRFFQERVFISQFIDEWAPIQANQFAFMTYTTETLIILTLFFGKIFHKKAIKDFLLLLPLLPLPFLAYSASRNVFLGYITLSIYLTWALAQFNWSRIYPVAKSIGIILLAAIVIFFGQEIQDKKKMIIEQRLYYPVQATQFIKKYHVQGNMYNEYGYGGYLLYNLYPQQKVFIDGRTDVYLCCEMKDEMQFALHKRESDPQYKKLLDAMWNKYHISFVVIRTEKHSILRKIGRILTDDPDWSLVFWDDNSELFIRHDGKNNTLLKEFAALAASPYNQNPYRTGQEKQASTEFQRMIAIADSARSRNAIGYLELKQGQFDEAKQQFERALQLDPTFESPYMNLAEIKAKDSDIESAIQLYTSALKLAPDRGLIYIRLGQLYLSQNNPLNAKKIWQQGLQNTVDSAAKSQITKLLSTL